MYGRRSSVVSRRTPEPAASLSSSERLYTRLLAVYPARYRREYGPLMTQLFRDLLRDTRRSGSKWGLAGLWLRVTAELGATASREHVAEIERLFMEANAKSGNAFSFASGRALLFAALVIAGALLAKIIVLETGGSMALATGIAVALNLAAAVIMERAVHSGGTVLLAMTVLIAATLLPLLWVADAEAWLRENPVNGFIVILVSAYNARRLRWPILAAAGIMGAALIAISFL